MTTDSSTGGYLSPTLPATELYDDALEDFLHDLVVGITGLDPTMVRPRWQPETPILPDANGPGIGMGPFGSGGFGAQPWAAIGVINRTPDAYSYVAHTAGTSGSPATPGFDTEYRSEILTVQLSFYGPSAESLTAQLCMGLKIAQNREQLMKLNYPLVNTDAPVNVPELIQERWVFRTDLTFRVRHMAQYQYAVLDVASAQAIAETDTALNEQITVTEP